MATNPVDPVEEEAEYIFSDSEIRASIEEYLLQENEGTLSTGYTTEEIRQRLGLDPSPLTGEE
jgi:hypothetical protein